MVIVFAEGRKIRSLLIGVLFFTSVCLTGFTIFNHEMYFYVSQTTFKSYPSNAFPTSINANVFGISFTITAYNPSLSSNTYAINNNIPVTTTMTYFVKYNVSKYDSLNRIVSNLIIESNITFSSGYSHFLDRELVEVSNDKASHLPDGKYDILFKLAGYPVNFKASNFKYSFVLSQGTIQSSDNHLPSYWIMFQYVLNGFVDVTFSLLSGLLAFVVIFKKKFPFLLSIKQNSFPIKEERSKFNSQELQSLPVDQYLREIQEIINENNNFSDWSMK